MRAEQKLRDLEETLMDSELRRVASAGRGVRAPKFRAEAHGFGAAEALDLVWCLCGEVPCSFVLCLRGLLDV